VIPRLKVCWRRRLARRRWRIGHRRRGIAGVFETPAGVGLLVAIERALRDGAVGELRRRAERKSIEVFFPLLGLV
jgi:hypothetical protein